MDAAEAPDQSSDAWSESGDRSEGRSEGGSDEAESALDSDTGDTGLRRSTRRSSRRKQNESSGRKDRRLTRGERAARRQADTSVAAGNGEEEVEEEGELSAHEIDQSHLQATFPKEGVADATAYSGTAAADVYVDTQAGVELVSHWDAAAAYSDDALFSDEGHLEENPEVDHCNGAATGAAAPGAAAAAAFGDGRRRKRKPSYFLASSADGTPVSCMFVPPTATMQLLAASAFSIRIGVLSFPRHEDDWGYDSVRADQAHEALLSAAPPAPVAAASEIAVPHPVLSIAMAATAMNSPRDASSCGYEKGSSTTVDASIPHNAQSSAAFLSSNPQN
jgi:hypothetical protein